MILISLLLSACAPLRLKIISEERWVRVTYEETSCDLQRVNIVLSGQNIGSGFVTFLYEDSNRKIYIEKLVKARDYDYLYHGHDINGILYTVYFNTDRDEVYISHGCVNMSVSKTRCK